MKETITDIRKRDPMQAVISDVNVERLDYTICMGNMCFKMAGRHGKRVKQLSRDTATAFHHTCQGVVALKIDLLICCQYDHVCIGKLTTDPLEKGFGKLR